MAISGNDQGTQRAVSAGQLRLSRFQIEALFGGPDQDIHFPIPEEDDPNPQVLILAGVNGSGKTTILRMIGGMLGLDFDVCRRVPFKRAVLELSSGKRLEIIKYSDEPGFMAASFDGVRTYVAHVKERNAEYERQIADFRRSVLPITSGVEYDLLSVNRSAQPEESREETYFDANRNKRTYLRNARSASLQERVKKFLYEAQIDHRRFFRSQEFDLLSRILRAIDASDKEYTPASLIHRVETIKHKAAEMQRFGLYNDEKDLDVLLDLLRVPRDSYALAVISTYVATLESAHSAREMIAQRARAFEAAMDDFLVGKTVRIDVSDGLAIRTQDGEPLSEGQLSSGEYHFLYMMVSALLCQRTGSVIAIDEPELSLHVTWQRKLITALARCAAGASPLFLLATHSMAISAQHRNSVYEVTALE